MSQFISYMRGSPGPSFFLNRGRPPQQQQYGRQQQQQPYVQQPQQQPYAQQQRQQAYRKQQNGVPQFTQNPQVQEGQVQFREDGVSPQATAPPLFPNPPERPPPTNPMAPQCSQNEDPASRQGGVGLPQLPQPPYPLRPSIQPSEPEIYAHFRKFVDEQNERLRQENLYLQTLEQPPPYSSREWG